VRMRHSLQSGPGELRCYPNPRTHSCTLGYITDSSSCLDLYRAAPQMAPGGAHAPYRGSLHAGTADLSGVRGPGSCSRGAVGCARTTADSGGRHPRLCPTPPPLQKPLRECHEQLNVSPQRTLWLRCSLNTHTTGAAVCSKPALPLSRYAITQDEGPPDCK